MCPVPSRVFLLLTEDVQQQFASFAYGKHISIIVAAVGKTGRNGGLRTARQ
jgi:hypothetical protein